jgi:hypothetical protein
VVVTARWRGQEGKESLGCCSYANEEEFRKDQYFEDLCQEALDALNKKLDDLDQDLNTLRED